MAHSYDIEICIACIEDKLPSYGCAIRLKHFQSQTECLITSGLGSGDPIYKSFKLAKSALRHKDAYVFIRYNVDNPNDSRLVLTDITWGVDCISLLDMAKTAALNQEYKYNARLEPQGL